MKLKNIGYLLVSSFSIFVFISTLLKVDHTVENCQKLKTYIESNWEDAEPNRVVTEEVEIKEEHVGNLIKSHAASTNTESPFSSSYYHEQLLSCFHDQNVKITFIGTGTNPIISTYTNTPYKVFADNLASLAGNKEIETIYMNIYFYSPDKNLVIIPKPESFSDKFIKATITSIIFATTMCLTIKANSSE